MNVKSIAGLQLATPYEIFETIHIIIIVFNLFFPLRQLGTFDEGSSIMFPSACMYVRTYVGHTAHLIRNRDSHTRVLTSVSILASIQLSLALSFGARNDERYLKWLRCCSLFFLLPRQLEKKFNIAYYYYYISFVHLHYYFDYLILFSRGTHHHHSSVTIISHNILLTPLTKLYKNCNSYHSLLHVNKQTLMLCHNTKFRVCGNNTLVFTRSGA